MFLWAIVMNCQWPGELSREAFTQCCRCSRQNFLGYFLRFAIFTPRLEELLLYRKKGKQKALLCFVCCSEQITKRACHALKPYVCTSLQAKQEVRSVAICVILFLW